jgi:hypothetical protein
MVRNVELSVNGWNRESYLHNILNFRSYFEKTHCISFTRLGTLIMFKQTFTVYFQNHINFLSTVCKYALLNVKASSTYMFACGL